MHIPFLLLWQLVAQQLPSSQSQGRGALSWLLPPPLNRLPRTRFQTIVTLKFF